MNSIVTWSQGQQICWTSAFCRMTISLMEGEISTSTHNIIWSDLYRPEEDKNTRSFINSRTVILMTCLLSTQDDIRETMIPLPSWISISKDHSHALLSFLRIAPKRFFQKEESIYLHWFIWCGLSFLARATESNHWSCIRDRFWKVAKWFFHSMKR